MNLKTKSYGKDDKRHLVVYKVMTLPEILETLLGCGGENEKYLLLPPRGEDDSSNLSMSNSTVIAEEDNLIALTEKVRTDEIREKVTLSVSKSDSEQDKPSRNCPSGSLSEMSKPDHVQSKDVDRVKDIFNRDPAGSKCNSSEPVIGGVSLSTNAEGGDESDIALINRIIDTKREGLYQSVAIYNQLVHKYLAEGSLTKKDRKTYLYHRANVQKSCGVGKRIITDVDVKEVNPRDVLIGIGEITHLKDSEELVEMNQQVVGHQLVTKPQQITKCIRANELFNSQQRGLQILNEKPELITDQLKTTIQHFKEAEAGGNRAEIKRFRRQVKFHVEALGGRTDLPKHYYS